jgi:anaerobic C4-dicarboxylate transporter
VLPTYPTLLAAVEMDDTGSTRIGKYVFNHAFLIPGVVAITLCVISALSSAALCCKRRGVVKIVKIGPLCGPIH